MIYFSPKSSNTSFRCFFSEKKSVYALNESHLYFTKRYKISIKFSSGEYGGIKYIFNPFSFHSLDFSANNLLL